MPPVNKDGFGRYEEILDSEFDFSTQIFPDYDKTSWHNLRWSSINQDLEKAQEYAEDLEKAVETYSTIVEDEMHEDMFNQEMERNLQELGCELEEENYKKLKWLAENIGREAANLNQARTDLPNKEELRKKIIIDQNTSFDEAYKEIRETYETIENTVQKVKDTEETAKELINQDISTRLANTTAMELLNDYSIWNYSERVKQQNLREISEYNPRSHFKKAKNQLEELDWTEIKNP